MACWGDNQFGQIGDGTTERRPRPSRVPGLANVVELAATCFTTCARLEDGTVRCWGQNGAGEAGNGTESPQRAPVVAEGLSDVVAIDGLALEWLRGAFDAA